MATATFILVVVLLVLNLAGVFGLRDRAIRKRVTLEIAQAHMEAGLAEKIAATLARKLPQYVPDTGIDNPDEDLF